jgi:Flp pilus assembly protein TadD
MTTQPQIVTVSIGVRDSHGLPLEEKASVKLSSKVRGFYKTFLTEQSSSASFTSILEGPYDLEVQCPGYVTVVEHLDINEGSAFFSTYVYMHSKLEPEASPNSSQGLVLTPKLAKEIDKGLESMRKKQYETAKRHFENASRILPKSPDILYLQGTAELGLAQPDAARQDFQQALAFDPSHEKTLLALGELQLQSGDYPGATKTLVKAYDANGAGWKTRYLLATAYAKTGRLTEAEFHAAAAVRLARSNAAPALLLLGDIQEAEDKLADAKQSWERIETEFPASPDVAAARMRIADASGEHPKTTKEVPVTLATSALKIELPAAIEERAWAPPDIDSKEYSVAPDVTCNADEIIPRAMRRMKSQLENLEKFGATEHIEHQEIDKNGLAGPIKVHAFYYLVFVVPQKSDSVFLEESRDGGISGAKDFPTSLATIGLNSLGVSVLQPIYRRGFNYQCEGLANIRGSAAWQVRFEEKQGANLDVRRWQRLGTYYNIPLKGRIWLSSTSFDLLRIETDLREPVVNLELSRDHLQVDYGPVKFAAGKTQLWLPWNAEMYLELHGKRYHHKHVLTDYMLFGVDTSHKINAPKGVPAEQELPQDEPPHP